ncbi:MAG: S8 family serine peptidase, partial [Solirubrobacteraceae bacterium]
FTGTGVTVAVLDTGVDATHPDLAGRVAEQREFIDDGLGTSDVVGHGTHVASTIAGNGAASGGKFRGVAPDATLISGRVCEPRGCPGSAILAGMAWAAAEAHAQIVNMSLGGDDTPDIDPLEDAVNQLSAQYGTLFVIAAGNRGFSAQTIESPGSADAALTVGAIDRDGTRAEFSGQGPRVGDEALKPDLTAPGVGIVAARASVVGPDPSDPNSPSYLAISGTSMATPHVAGAATLVHQQHPSWTGAQLKAALMAAAAPNPAQTALEQGAGLVDLERATRQALAAEPPSLSLGAIESPFTGAQTRTLTYRNDGGQAITLALTATLAPTGAPTPPGMITVSPAALTVPAGGAAAATVTVDHQASALEGQFSGAVIATAGDQRVVTPIAVDRHPPAFNLTLRALDTAGAPTRAGVLVIALPSGDTGQILVDGEATLRLAIGRYALSATLSDPDSVDMLEYPRL